MIASGIGASGLGLEGSPEEQDARAVRQAWAQLAAPMPLQIEERLATRQFFDAALDLAHRVVGQERLHGFRLSFTSLGGPYAATLILAEPDGGGLGEVGAEHETSLVQALVAAIFRWAREQSAS
ncbi:hypothetical protein [Enterovirga aerilata]|uniref:Uncharacterized protein n=1 Tax=Enterovirga aerilata TaxID=2730920 RepID=A0A849IFW8_9HYPH|nr:hypothetical protein [Enterovirga sp. DB1703]NNM72813.1 hypothetical protein [Enterovirga sp. DB1703]